MPEAGRVEESIFREDEAQEAELLVLEARAASRRLLAKGNVAGHRRFVEEADRLAAAARAIRGESVGGVRDAAARSGSQRSGLPGSLHVV
jgi:hypothetical protein